MRLTNLSENFLGSGDVLDGHLAILEFPSPQPRPGDGGHGAELQEALEDALDEVGLCLVHNEFPVDYLASEWGHLPIHIPPARDGKLVADALANDFTLELRKREHKC